MQEYIQTYFKSYNLVKGEQLLKENQESLIYVGDTKACRKDLLTTVGSAWEPLQRFVTLHLKAKDTR